MQKRHDKNKLLSRKIILFLVLLGDLFDDVITIVMFPDGFELNKDNHFLGVLTVQCVQCTNKRNSLGYSQFDYMYV